ncbi:lactococcin 972 family bacteriocin [Streptomyces sp. NPDC055092]
MKISRKIGAAAAVAAVVATGFLSTAAPASAADAVVEYTATASDVAPAFLFEGGQAPTEWGYARISVDSTDPLSVTTTKSKGGGTWSYGTRRDGTYKGCYSNYIHPSKKHSATIAISDVTDKDVRGADIWARAYGKAGGAYTCYAYWGVY